MVPSVADVVVCVRGVVIEVVVVSLVGDIVDVVTAA